MTAVPSSDPTALRAAMLDALGADLIGPYDFDTPETATEVLELPPSRWYLTGFLACEADRVNDDPDADDDGGAGDDTDEGGTAAPEADEQSRQRRFFPASVGLSVLLPPGSDDALSVRVSFAEYHRVDGTEDALDLGVDEEGKPRQGQQWRRVAHAVEVAVPLDRAALARGVGVPGSGGLWLEGRCEVWQGRAGLADGTRSVALFLVNKRRAVDDKGRRDEGWVFQVRLRVQAPAGQAFVSRPDLRTAASEEWDDRIADLQFRGVRRFAVGHGIGVEQGDDGTWVATRWLPEGRALPVRTRAVAAVETRMEVLAGLSDGAALREALWPVVIEYRAWIEARRGDDVGGRAAVRDELLADASVAASRIADGIARLASDETARQAFCWMNAAMAAAARQRSPERHAAPPGRPEGEGRPPEWRLFQLAFVLLNVNGIATPDHEDRDIVELVYFPTGGGKTEAYLGVIGFTLLLRRLHGQSRDDGGLGVAVLLRYTLRLLTLDQLGRAATLICALERLRRGQVERLGDTRFAIGLWVGRSATANTMAQVRVAVSEHKENRASSPFPLPACPWCREALRPAGLHLVPDAKKPSAVQVNCSATRCDFNQRGGGLPVLFVDEQIYRELPCFVLATVDKFAMLPWRGETGALFGRVSARGGDGFYGPMDDGIKGGVPLPQGLLPPELIVQDEVHLISGPLGTMTGLYETAIDALSVWQTVGGSPRRPKVLASTATVRRAEAQMQALFGRGATRVFPPPGVDDGESFFAERDPSTPDRRYVGVAAAGRAFKAVQLRVYVTLLAAAQKLWVEHGSAVDGYMTVVGYFNSLRELGGMRRLAEDEVRARAKKAGERRPLDKRGAPHRWLARRDVASDPVELTSRESTANIAKTKHRLGVAHGEKGAVDVALATNMISVGLDIDRLGLMVVSGQPKTTAEYIQASSRVGRQAKTRPGLVVTCQNSYRPRDRSHYEDFVAWHEAFYGRVEVNSLTPFSKPALDRGLAGLLVAMVRLMDPALTPPSGVERLAVDRATAERVVELIVERAKTASLAGPDELAALTDDLRQRLVRLVDDWATLMVEAKTEEAGRRCYSRLDRGRHGKPLLLPRLEADSVASLKPAERRFSAPTSMRDVEPAVHIWVNRAPGQG